MDRPTCYSKDHLRRREAAGEFAKAFDVYQLALASS